MVEHMFSEEEAEVAKHLKPWRPMTAKKLAAATGVPLREIEAILDVLAMKNMSSSPSAGGIKNGI